MRIYPFIAALGLAMAALTACENVDENERFNGPVDITPKKNVLIEDFTGQRCANCPLATEELKNIQGVYGAEHVISVAIHGGSLGLSEEDRPTLGLANSQSAELYEYWEVKDQPNGLIDRKGGLQPFSNWFGLTINRLIEAPKADIRLQQPAFDPATRKLSLHAEVESNVNVEGKLQLWLTESNLVRIQSLPAQWGGGNDKKYVHNHVFRAAVNDLFGDELVLQAGQTQSRDYEYTLKDHWVEGNMAVIAIFYNEADGVMQVTEQPVIPHNTNP